ncbi:radical SAM family heme chaperone HemW [Aquibaculum arenosum]|uniref:Heme chaperone HemW n=1 Tax=Aquibaculum arenosum TaxID=3032591 RepID=A0ABT5YJK0_9PROT|nr:radical SAM family heme chaperone HemW [Fodinicurvata sp. CAU 1616]MDF2095069.1 radical SAM family heme chaperone HemW [Fodinicurvata sp. CAU 1616]
MAQTAPDPGFGLYVHWPFCLAKCPYCDFNSHVRAKVDQQRWRRALLAELDHFGRRTAGRKLTSVFFGGGTPSLMAPETVAAILERLQTYWLLDPALEVTLEANPTSAEAERFAGFAAAGVNRLSIGVQALDNAALAFLGRQHSFEEALEAVALARRSVPRFSFDLIYGRAGQTPAEWRDELSRALDEGPEHLSLYQLTIEPGTQFHAAARRGELPLLDDDRQATLFELTAEMLEVAGLPAYEISNHARPGAESRHNLTYWRYGDYVGIGPGAHGRLTTSQGKYALRQHRAPEAWLQRVETLGHATRQESLLTREERLAELLMMGLRLTDGIPRAAFQREFGAQPDALLDSGRLAGAQEAGYLHLDDERLHCSSEGRLRLNALLPWLLHGTA